jgi:CDP-glucose 4,6-dehydratase
MIVQKQYEDTKYADYYNVGPDESDCITTGRLVDLFCSKWEAATGKKQIWINKYDGDPHEANFLKLDCSKLRSIFGWKPRWNVETTIEKTVEWTKVYFDGGNVTLMADKQIDEFLGGTK